MDFKTRFLLISLFAIIQIFTGCGTPTNEKVITKSCEMEVSSCQAKSSADALYPLEILREASFHSTNREVLIVKIEDPKQSITGVEWQQISGTSAGIEYRPDGVTHKAGTTTSLAVLNFTGIRDRAEFSITITDSSGHQEQVYYHTTFDAQKTVWIEIGGERTVKSGSTVKLASNHYTTLTNIERVEWEVSSPSVGPNPIDFEFTSNDLKTEFTAPSVDEQTWLSVSIRAYDTENQSHFESFRMYVVPENYWVEVEKLFPGDISAALRKDGTIQFDEYVTFNGLSERLQSPESVKFITHGYRIAALINAEGGVEIYSPDSGDANPQPEVLKNLTGAQKIALGNEHMMLLMDDGSVQILNRRGNIMEWGSDLSGLIKAKAVDIYGLTPLIIDVGNKLYGLCGDDQVLLLLAENVKQVDGEFLLLNDNRVVTTPSCKEPQTYVTQGFEGVGKIEKIHYSYELRHTGYILALLENGSVVTSNGGTYLGLDQGVADIAHGAAQMSNGDIFNLTNMRVAPHGPSRLNLKND